MTARLVAALDAALAGAVQNVPKDASVMVQFAAGDYAEILAALAEAKQVSNPPAPVGPAEVTTTPGEQPPA